MNTNLIVDKITNTFSLAVANSTVEDHERGDDSKRTTASKIWEKRHKKILEKEKEKLEDQAREAARKSRELESKKVDEPIVHESSESLSHSSDALLSKEDRKFKRYERKIQ
jgi:hypothetical protein